MSRDPDKIARTTPGRSEFSHGVGMHPNPKISYDDGRVDPRTSAVNAARGMSLDDQLLSLRAYRRLDSAATDETLEEMYTAEGNTDRFGANPPLVNADDRKTRRDYGPEPEPWRMKRES